jgi:hypothetical protein
MTCPICGKESMGTSGLCAHHESATTSILAAYQKWVTAYGGMDWVEYLHNIEKLEGSGEWTREVASYLVHKKG